MKNVNPLVFILGILIAIALFLIGQYNNLVSADEQVKEAWSNVETQYQRRADLIPNLVNTVKGYASHEENVLKEVVEARSKALQTTVNINDPDSIAGFQQVQGELSSALSKLLLLVENYPELKANQNFLTLQAQLEWTENRIANARRKYNEAVRRYNTLIRSFPTKFIAEKFWFKPKVWFKAENKVQGVPVVDFER